MISGFDYGTSNCAVGVPSEAGQVRLLGIENQKPYMPSILYALDRDLICEQVGLSIPCPDLQEGRISSCLSRPGHSNPLQLSWQHLWS